MRNDNVSCFPKNWMCKWMKKKILAVFCNHILLKLLINSEQERGAKQNIPVFTIFPTHTHETAVCASEWKKTQKIIDLYLLITLTTANFPGLWIKVGKWRLKCWSCIFSLSKIYSNVTFETGWICKTGNLYCFSFVEMSLFWNSCMS